jgi:PAS domain-containing protein
MRDEAGTLRGYAKVARDDTLRKCAEEEREHLVRSLETERSRLCTIFIKAPAFVATLRGSQHTFELVNPAYYQVVGHRALIGKSIREALPEIEGQGYFELLDQVLQTGVPYEGRASRVLLQREPSGPPRRNICRFPVSTPDRG